MNVIPFTASEIAEALEPDPEEPEPDEPERWPDPPAEAVYHGVAGDLVRAVADGTEADPIALLGTFLAIFGALAGHGRYLYQGSAQSANLYIVLVGETGRGRKGTAFSIGRAVFDAALPDWETILVPGLGSGEGLIGHLKRSEGTEHRALVLETELGRLLSVMAREGSTLSPTLRDAWDGVPLGRFLAREGSIVTRHHVGCLAHVTPVELRAKLTDTDAANGFGNRFLWPAVRRTRLVPFPVSPGEAITPFIEPLHRAIIEAQTPAELHFSAAGADRWEGLYADLASRTRYGLAGALTGRAEAQLARLALVYALLDRSTAVEPVHLDAAAAFWDYSERSVRHLFGESTGNRLADWVLGHLRREGPPWPTRYELRKESGQHDASRLAEALELLVGLRLVRLVRGQGSAKGGPRPEYVELVGGLPRLPRIPPRDPRKEEGCFDA